MRRKAPSMRMPRRPPPIGHQKGRKSTESSGGTQPRAAETSPSMQSRNPWRSTEMQLEDLEEWKGERAAATGVRNVKWKKITAAGAPPPTNKKRHRRSTGRRPRSLRDKRQPGPRPTGGPKTPGRPPVHKTRDQGKSNNKAGETGGRKPGQAIPQPPPEWREPPTKRLPEVPDLHRVTRNPPTQGRKDPTPASSRSSNRRNQVNNSYLV